MRAALMPTLPDFALLVLWSGAALGLALWAIRRTSVEL